MDDPMIFINFGCIFWWNFKDFGNRKFQDIRMLLVLLKLLRFWWYFGSLNVSEKFYMSNELSFIKQAFIYQRSFHISEELSFIFNIFSRFWKQQNSLKFSKVTFIKKLWKKCVETSEKCENSSQYISIL